MSDIVIVAHNLRSAHNIGSLLRTADGLGIIEVYLTGYTPYPIAKNDSRLPHIARKVHTQISKTALGAEGTQQWKFETDVFAVIEKLKKAKYEVIALEQAPNSIPLPEYQPKQKVAIIIGREVEGMEPDLIKKCDQIVEIPMFGSKESFNVIQAAAMAAYHCRFYPFHA